MTHLPLFLMMFGALNAAMAVNPAVLDGVGADDVPVVFRAFQLLLGGESNGNEPGPIEGGFR